MTDGVEPDGVERASGPKAQQPIKYRILFEVDRRWFGFEISQPDEGWLFGAAVMTLRWGIGFTVGLGPVIVYLSIGPVDPP